MPEPRQSKTIPCVFDAKQKAWVPTEDVKAGDYLQFTIPGCTELAEGAEELDQLLSLSSLHNTLFRVVN